MVLYNQDKRKIYDIYNNINQADNYESNNADIDYLDRFTSLENSTIEDVTSKQWKKDTSIAFNTYIRSFRAHLAPANCFAKTSAR